MSIRDEIKRKHKQNIKQGLADTIDKDFIHPPTNLIIRKDEIIESQEISKPEIKQKYYQYRKPLYRPIPPKPVITPLPRHTRPPLVKHPPSNTPPSIRKRRESPTLRRKRRILENGGSHTPKDWIMLQEKFNFCCVSCGIHAKDTPQKYLTRDHIIPIVKGGSDDISNIQPMCLRCNFRKNTKLL